MATSNPLCLEPDPNLTRIVNNILRVSTPNVPNSLKRKVVAMDPEEDESEKIKRTKIMQYMNPQTGPTRKSSQNKFVVYVTGFKIITDSHIILQIQHSCPTRKGTSGSYPKGTANSTAFYTNATRSGWSWDNGTQWNDTRERSEGNSTIYRLLYTSLF